MELPFRIMCKYDDVVEPIEKALLAESAFKDVKRSTSPASDFDGKIQGNSEAEILSKAQDFHDLHGKEILECIVFRYEGDFSWMPLRTVAKETAPIPMSSSKKFTGHVDRELVAPEDLRKQLRDVNWELFDKTLQKEGL